jgi:hypothetical protein
MMPVSAEKFWQLIHNYDSAVFPVQFAFTAAAVFLLFRLRRKPGAALDRWINLFLMACYLWIGIVFFLVFNAELSRKLCYFQPALMFLIALLFGLDLFRKKNHFRLPVPPGGRTVVLALLTYSIAGYPLVGWLLGHPYSVEISRRFSLWVPILGVYPCPTTIFALALLGAGRPRADGKVMIPLLFWALFSIAGPPLRLYGVYEDIGLFLAGIYGLIRLIGNTKRKER